jgi:RNA polymerase sigma-70 factor (ECF subfamily)
MTNDPILLLEYRKGNPEAFNQLYLKYSPSLKRFLLSGFSFSSQGRYCRFRGADASMDVEALIHETFTRAFSPTTRENYDGVRPFQTYLFSIAKNLVLRECHYRERNFVADHSEDNHDSQSLFSPATDLHSAQGPERQMLNKELQNLTQKFIVDLSDEERSFFSWRFARGLTQEATAAKMGTTRARIKLLEKNVRKRFLDLLREAGYMINYVPNPRWKRHKVAQAQGVGQSMGQHEEHVSGSELEFANAA